MCVCKTKTTTKISKWREQSDKQQTGETNKNSTEQQQTNLHRTAAAAPEAIHDVLTSNVNIGEQCSLRLNKCKITKNNMQIMAIKNEMGKETAIHRDRVKTHSRIAGRLAWVCLAKVATAKSTANGWCTVSGATGQVVRQSASQSA